MIGALGLTTGQLSSMGEQPRHGEAPANRTAPARVEAESSFALVQRAHAGDRAACNELFVRYLPRLQRWAHGRLPASARGALDTHDLVQDTFIRVLNRIEDFEPRHEGAFQAYLRRALLNNVFDQIRRTRRQAPAEPLDSSRPDADPSPLELAIGSETLERYEAALERLKPSDREVIILRIELGYSHAEVADALNKPSAAAAQMAANRALVRLAEEMSRGRD